MEQTESRRNSVRRFSVEDQAQAEAQNYAEGSIEGAENVDPFQADYGDEEGPADSQNP